MDDLRTFWTGPDATSVTVYDDNLKRAAEIESPEALELLGEPTSFVTHAEFAPSTALKADLPEFARRLFERLCKPRRYLEFTQETEPPAAHCLAWEGVWWVLEHADFQCGTRWDGRPDGWRCHYREVVCALCEEPITSDEVVGERPDGTFAHEACVASWGVPLVPNLPACDPTPLTDLKHACRWLSGRLPARYAVEACPEGLRVTHTRTGAQAVFRGQATLGQLLNDVNAWREREGR